MYLCSKILYRKTQLHCQHGKPPNIGHAISLLNLYSICIVPDQSSITNIVAKITTALAEFFYQLYI